jgi:RNA polymerase sigma factor (sigma-70 family)
MDIGFDADLPLADLDEVPGAVALSREARLRFEAAYREHHRAVLRLLRWRLGDDPDIPDLMQESYLRILRYRDCGPESLKLLLFRTALNLATSHGVLARRRMPHLQFDELELQCEGVPLDEALDRDCQIRDALNAAAQLPPRCREVFLLRLLHGLRQREIAARCGISTRMVEQHLSRAQTLIRERIATLAA